MTDKEYRMMQRRRLLTERGKKILDWVRSEGERYKDAGVFSLSLADYYANPEDVEVAAIVECLIPNPLDEASSTRIGYITELHNILGDSPSGYVRERRFVMDLRPEREMDGLLGQMGVQKVDLFNMLDWIWSVRDVKATLEAAFLEYAGLRRVGGQIPDLRGQISHELNPCAVRLALMRLCLTDGMGRGVWKSILAEDLPCPMDSGVKRMLRRLYPVGIFADDEADEIISYLGWDVPCEFVYSYLACRGFEDEMAEIGERLRSAVDGKISAATWHKFYKDGMLFTPKHKDALEKERARVREKKREIRAK